jgi:streptomycin 6-kinase
MTTTIELVNEVAEFSDISELMNDDQLTDALAIIVKLMMSPDVPAQKAVGLIVQLEAYAAKFKMLASYYTNVKKDERAKKNLYYSANEAVQRLVDSLKYSAKLGSYYG